MRILATGLFLPLLYLSFIGLSIANDDETAQSTPRNIDKSVTYSPGKATTTEADNKPSGQAPQTSTDLPDAQDILQILTSSPEKLVELRNSAEALLHCTIDLGKNLSETNFTAVCDCDGVVEIKAATSGKPDVRANNQKLLLACLESKITGTKTLLDTGQLPLKPAADAPNDLLHITAAWAGDRDHPQFRCKPNTVLGWFRSQCLYDKATPVAGAASTNTVVPRDGVRACSIANVTIAGVCGNFDPAPQAISRIHVSYRCGSMGPVQHTETAPGGPINLLCPNVQ